MDFVSWLRVGVENFAPQFPNRYGPLYENNDVDDDENTHNGNLLRLKKILQIQTIDGFRCSSTSTGKQRGSIHWRAACFRQIASSQSSSYSNRNQFNE
jgi:hypothetical protein